jgi:hypothetical protein
MRARLSIAVSLGLLIAADARAEVSPEYSVKAAYLPKFIPFITWPDAAFATPDAPVTICVLGADPFGGKLEQAAEGLKSGEHAIVVRYLPAPDASAFCHLAFVGKDNEVAAEEMLESMKGKPVVTVTDTGLEAQGVINFVTAANQVRFDIDEAAAARNGVVISSKLLSLARAVKPRSQP